MLASILKAAGAFLSLIATAVGWGRDTALKNEGRQLQAADDIQAKVKGDRDAQKIRSDVAGMSGAELDRELRGPAAANSR